MKNLIIEAENLTKIYKNQSRRLITSPSLWKKVNFSDSGPNGAGKTTTIKMLTTLASVTEGKASVAGFNVGEHASKVRECIGVVPQELTADDELKGMENLLLSAKLHHVPDDVAHSTAKDLFDLLELEGGAG